MNRVLSGAILVLGTACGATSVASAEDLYFTQIALHRKATTTKVATTCTTYTPNAEGLPCPFYTVTGPVGQYSMVYILVGFGPDAGVNAVSFGIDYNGRVGGGVRGDSLGIDPSFATFTPCFDGDVFPFDGGYGPFPAPRGAAYITATTCQGREFSWGGMHSVVGALTVYLYGEDILRITPNSLRSPSPEILVSDCAGHETNLLDLHPGGPIPFTEWLARVHFGGTGSGGLRCFYPDSPRPITWGRLKSFYPPTATPRGGS